MLNVNIGKEIKYFTNIISTATLFSDVKVDRLELKPRPPELFNVTRLPKELWQSPHDLLY